MFNECPRYLQTIKREHVVLNNRCVLELEGVERKCALRIGNLVNENGGHGRLDGAVLFHLGSCANTLRIMVEAMSLLSFFPSPFP